MAKSISQLSWAALIGVSCAALSATSYSEDSTQTPSRWKCKWCAIDEQQGLSGNVTLGLGALSEDSYRYDEYLGNGSDGAVYDLGLGLNYWGEEGFWSSLGLSDLGLDSRQAQIEVGDIGLFQFKFEYDETTQRTLNDGLSPYFLQGSTATLPLDWAPASSTFLMAGNLGFVDLKTKRKRVSASGQYQTPLKNILLDFSSTQETKKGTQGFSGAFGDERAFSALAAQFAVPVDQNTADLDFGVQYKLASGSVRVGYNLSLFSQDIDSILWANAYEDDFAGNQFGRAATAPDNQFHQLSINGNTRLAAKTRLSGYYNVGEMTQDEDFLDYSSNALFTNNLPVSSLDGKISTLHTGLFLVSSPFTDWRFTANYKLDERENKTDRYAYEYVVLDSTESLIIRANSPYSFSKQKTALKANHRLNRKIKLSGGVDYISEERSYQEVADLDETVLWMGVKAKLLPELSAKLKVEQFDRKADGYEERAEINPAENSLLRKYHLADSDGNKSKLTLDYAPLDTVSLMLSLEGKTSDYSDTIIGLTARDSQTATFDVGYYPIERLNCYAFYSFEMLEYEQAGSQSGGTSDWENTVTDDIDTLGVGFSFLTEDKKLKYGMDYLYSDATEQSKLVTELEFADALPSSDNKLQSVSAFYQRDINERYQVRLDVIYEAFEDEDYQFTDIEPDSSSSVLAFGDGDADYEVWSVMLNNTYRF
ncbi:MAG: hypothetical protein COB51_12420 [Moraxellaceae bacterium]|nr:MAG: hypothetical protein COB51_12420 [Moraxellaceae bacterium]